MIRKLKNLCCIKVVVIAFCLISKSLKYLDVVVEIQLVMGFRTAYKFIHEPLHLVFQYLLKKR